MYEAAAKAESTAYLDPRTSCFYSRRALSEEARHELADEVAGLPSELESEPEESKRFDLLMLRLQLAVLMVEPAFVRLRDQVKEIAGLLEEKENIPMVHAHLPLIQDLQSDEWWQDVTAPMLETVRKKLRDLIQFIEKAQRRSIVFDVPEVMGPETIVELPGFAGAGDFERFKSKTRAFLREHQDHVAVVKLRKNEWLTAADLAELEKMLAASGVGSPEEIELAKSQSEGLGVFIRSLVGLDREAAKRAFGGFLTGKTLNANQIEFVNLIVDYLTEHGVMDATLLYESPFTDIAPQGPDAIFAAEQIAALMAILRDVRATATAA